MIPVGPWCDHKAPCKEEAGGAEGRKAEVTTGAEGDRLEDTLWLDLKREDEATSQGMQSAFRSWKREGYRFFPETLSEHGPPSTLILVQGTPFWT